jgi:1,4-alpha-glucan branching enzyme
MTANGRAKRTPAQAAALACPEAKSIAAGTCDDPFAILGPHMTEAGLAVRVFIPGADAVSLVDGAHLADMERVHEAGIFTALVPGATAGLAYRLACRAGTVEWEMGDPYRFGPVIGPEDEHYFAEGTHLRLWEVLGAHVMAHEGAEGVHFAVWAPNAQRVSVVGDFNMWDGRRHVMRRRGSTGIWEIFMPGVGPGAAYKYELRTPAGEILPLKADPVGFGAEHAPATASIVRDIRGHEWRDGAWMAERQAAQAIDAPISIYEVHLGSWKRVPEDGNRPLSYLEHAAQLVPYARDMGFTHIELMPVSEHPFDGSWGYQPVGLYAPTIRYGTPEEFRQLVEAAHLAGLGLIIDWVPGHFPDDPHGLAWFDGTHLYEHADPREGLHPDWDTLVYNYGRREVANFLIANALYWLEEFHVDGLRVDAVASMLYRDYSRKADEWIPNAHGGRENLEAISLLQRMNEVAYGQHPGIATVAEESTAWGGVSRPTSAGGLGFGYKWNMGWMNDTLHYVARDPVHRRFHHHQITFGLYYAFSENFILPISHDEVVHGKGSLLARMPGEGAPKFANMRAYLGFMWAHPGKKLLFMGQEFAQGREWSHQTSLDWHLTDHPWHAGVQRLVKDLNRLYRETPALYERDCRADGFDWVEAGAATESVFAWMRYGEEGAAPILAITNFTPVGRSGWRVGVPWPGHWREVMNTDAEYYGGSGTGNLGGVNSEPRAWNGQDHSLLITLPPLTTLVFQLDV